MRSREYEEFRRTWSFVRGMTYEFIEAVPDDRWDFTPHPRFGPFALQVRHLVCAQGVYNRALTTGKVDFTLKNKCYSGGMAREPLLQALHQTDAELLRALDSWDHRGLKAFAVDFYGANMGFGEYTATMIQHEAIHQGQWTLYAALGDFETPIGWKENWNL